MPFPKGYKHTQEWKDKMSLKMKGHKSFVPVGFVPWNKGLKGVIKFSLETKMKMSKSGKGKHSEFLKGKPAWNKGKEMPKGENSPSWITDRTQLVKNEKKHLDYAYKDWMLKTRKLDNWKCRINNSDCSGRLESHHILDWKNFPELRYDINNGITLCHAHHPRGREREAKLSPFLQSLVAERN